MASAIPFRAWMIELQAVYGVARGRSSPCILIRRTNRTRSGRMYVRANYETVQSKFPIPILLLHSLTSLAYATTSLLIIKQST